MRLRSYIAHCQNPVTSLFCHELKDLLQKETASFFIKIYQTIKNLSLKLTLYLWIKKTFLHTVDRSICYSPLLELPQFCTKG